MVQELPAPEVLRCYFDDGFEPPLGAMCLRWDSAAATDPDRLWQLPEGVCLAGPPPRRFGVQVQRHAGDTYSLRLLWDRTCFHWPTLSRADLLTTDLSVLLHALGTDLWYLLDQPLEDEDVSPRRAA